MPPAIQSLRVTNLLSFGSDSSEFPLGPLNVLIGPNGSGKSNLIEAIGLLHSAPKDLAEPIREGGSVIEWLWKGSSVKVTATIESCVRPLRGDIPIRYRLSFTSAGVQLVIIDERIENSSPLPGYMRPYLYFGYEAGRPMLNVKEATRYLRPEDINPQQSILSQRKDPDQYPELTHVGQLFDSIRLYRDWEFGVNTRAREACPGDARTDFLEEDASNLALMVNVLGTNPITKPELRRYVKLFYEEAEDIYATIVAGRVELRLEERYKFTIPAIRMSDGTLRWLSLLTILLHPSPPPLVCIEEPELGLHPDMIRALAELLVGASERMQLIITTHSDLLVEELTAHPETVIVCEKESGETHLKRLSRAELSSWLERYSLAELWRKGQIGGNRW